MKETKNRTHLHPSGQLVVDEVLVLLGAHLAGDAHLVGVGGDAAKAVVEHNLHPGHGRPTSGAFMQQIVALLLVQRVELVAEHELNGVEEVALPTSVPSDHNVVFGREVADRCEVLVTPKPGDVNLNSIFVEKMVLTSRMYILTVCGTCR